MIYIGSGVTVKVKEDDASYLRCHFDKQRFGKTYLEKVKTQYDLIWRHEISRSEVQNVQSVKKKKNSKMKGTPY